MNRIRANFMIVIVIIFAFSSLAIVLRANASHCVNSIARPELSGGRITAAGSVSCVGNTGITFTVCLQQFRLQKGGWIDEDCRFTTEGSGTIRASCDVKIEPAIREFRTEVAYDNGHGAFKVVRSNTSKFSRTCIR